MASLKQAVGGNHTSLEVTGRLTPATERLSVTLGFAR